MPQDVGGRPDVALRLIDAALAGAATGDKAELGRAKAEILDEDLLDEGGATACYQAALAERPDDAVAAEALESLCALARLTSEVSVASSSTLPEPLGMKPLAPSASARSRADSSSSPEMMTTGSSRTRDTLEARMRSSRP